MATWPEIKAFIKNKYSHVEELNDELLKGTFFASDSDRSHLFFCELVNDAKLQFVAPVVEYSRDNAIKLLENNTSVYGVMIKGSDPGLLCLIDPQDMATLDEEEINVDMLAIADELEKDLFGGDQF